MPAVTSKKIKAFNPQRGMKKARPARKAAGKKKRKSNNPPGLMTLGFALGNPQNKEKSMKKRNKTKKAAPKSKRKSATKAKNPHRFKPAPARRHKKRSNPNGVLKTPMDNLKFGAAALVGLAATRQLPQLVMKDANSGWLGYLANLAVATLGGIGIGMKSKQLGYAFAIGGSLYTVSRVLTEKVSPVGKYFALAGVGDAAAAGMGDLEEGYFPVPVVTDANNKPMIPEAILRAAVVASLTAVDQRQRQVAAASAQQPALAGVPQAALPSRFRR
jgi:hypothetical protein